MTDLILYTTDDGKSRIQLRADERTVWLSEDEIEGLLYFTTDTSQEPSANSFVPSWLRFRFSLMPT